MMKVLNLVLASLLSTKVSAWTTLEERLAEMERRLHTNYDDAIAAHQSDYALTLEHFDLHVGEVNDKLASLGHELHESHHRNLQDSMDERLKPIEKLADALGCVNKKESTKDNLIFEGCNIQIQNGKGKTLSRNAVGNLIIGYNEADSCNVGGSGKECIRLGSHNLVVGPGHEWRAAGGIVLGIQNSLFNNSCSITGGSESSAGGQYGSIQGGYRHVMTPGSRWASISGGDLNWINALYATIGGGYFDTVNGGGNWAVVAGGYNNTVWTEDGVILGGDSNNVYGDLGVIVGGYSNVISETAGVGVILGGNELEIKQYMSTLPPVNAV